MSHAGWKKQMKMKICTIPKPCPPGTIIPSAAVVTGPSTYQGHSSEAAETVLCLLSIPPLLQPPGCSASTIMENSKMTVFFE